ncbi:MAG: vWA domain-containing protein [Planctomycetota bacterium]
MNAIGFAHPLLLTLLAIPLLLLVWRIRRPAPPVALPVDHASPGRRRVLRTLLGLADALPPLLLAVAILLLAGPRRPGAEERRRVLTNIQIVLDVSGSMTATFPGGETRYTAAMAAIDAFTTRRAGDAFGLTIFGNAVLNWTPLTAETAVIRLGTPFLRPGKLPGHFGGTEIARGVRSAALRLGRHAQGDRLLILLSDGMSYDIAGEAGTTLGRELAAEGIVLHAVHIGDGLAPQQLHDLAGPTGGTVAAADDTQALDAVFATIDRMQGVPVTYGRGDPVPVRRPFAHIGLALLALHCATSFGLRWVPW